MKLLLVNIIIATLFYQIVTAAPVDLTLIPIGLMESLHSVLFDSNILTTHPGTHTTGYILDKEVSNISANQDPSLNIVTWILYKEFQPEIYDPWKPPQKLFGIF